MDAAVGSVIGEAEASQVGRRPPTAPVRGITDETAPTRTKQSGRHIEHHDRRSEAAGGDDIRRRSPPGGDQGLDVRSDHIGTFTNAECLHAVPQEIGTLLAPLDQGDVQIGAIGRDHQRRQPAPGSEIDEMRDTGIRTGQRSDEAPRMRDGLGDRASADGTAALDLGENSREEFVVSHSPER